MYFSSAPMLAVKVKPKLYRSILMYKTIIHFIKVETFYRMDGFKNHYRFIMNPDIFAENTDCCYFSAILSITKTAETENTSHRV